MRLLGKARYSDVQGLWVDAQLAADVRHGTAVFSLFDRFHDLALCEFGLLHVRGSRLAVLPTYNQYDFRGALQALQLQISFKDSLYLKVLKRFRMVKVRHELLKHNAELQIGKYE